MRVLIIGGAGVLGQITTPALAERHTVRVLDLARSSVPGVESVVGDATSPDDVAAAMAGVDGVIHQAAVVPRGAQVDDPDRVSAAFSVNVASVHLAAATAV